MWSHQKVLEAISLSFEDTRVLASWFIAILLSDVDIAASATKDTYPPILSGPNFSIS